MTVGAPLANGGHYVLRGGAWTDPNTQTGHVPNPLPGRTTHLWDEHARTFGQAPLAPLPPMPTFVPDRTPYTGPRAIIADDLAAPGDTLTQIVAKAKAVASDPALLYVLVLSARVYEVNGFGDGLNQISGVDVPPNLALWGAGSGIDAGPTTTIRLNPHTSAYNITNCTWTGAYGTPKCMLLRCAKPIAGWFIRNLSVEGGKQGVDNNGRGHPYNGISLEEASNGPLVENVRVQGVRGYLAQPPGETGSITTWKSDRAVIRNVEIDGRELGYTGQDKAQRVSSAGIMIDEATNTALIDVHVHHTQCGGGAIALWWSRAVSTFNLYAHDMGGGLNTAGEVMGSSGVNQERVHLATHYSARITTDRLPISGNNGSSLQYTLNNDLLWDDTTGWTSATTGVPGRCLLIDPARDVTSDVFDDITVDIWPDYDPLGTGGTQRNGPGENAAPRAVTRARRPVTLTMGDGAGGWVKHTRPAL